jgi:formamidopyrimidine-DNA glycosylase
MPEIPDLEIFARNLLKVFKNKTLEKLEVVVPRKLKVPEDDLIAAFEGHQLQDVKREGKTLQLHFGGGNVLGVHLMLHGRLHPLGGEEEVKFQIIRFWFKGGEGFAVTDWQKQATPTLNPESSKVPDALAKEMNLAYFKKIVTGSEAHIKNLLMDQKKIRGLGNAYADEILWLARIHPFSISNKIPEDKIGELHKAIHNVLDEETKALGKAIPESYTIELRDFLKIHHHGLEKSPTGYEIKTQKNEGRNTYFTEEQELYK